METPFEELPIGSKEPQVVSFSVRSLRNPAVSMDQSKSGDYGTYIYKAQDLLQRVQEIGFWLPSQAKSYAKVYPSLNNALEVMERNILLKNIIEDTPMDMTWSYEKGENNDLVYEELNKVVHLDELNKLARTHNREELENAVSKVSAELQTFFGVDVATDIEYVYEGFWRIGLSRTIEGEDYSFYVNIDTDEKSVDILSYIPPTEILYAFNEFKSVPLIKDLLERHPRLNIQLPAGIEDRIRSRRKSEREYQEKVAKLSATNEISQREEPFESGIYVKQGDLQIIPADKGPIGTTGVGPCVAICARGINREGKMILGFAHMEAGQNENDILGQLEKGLESLRVPREEIEIFWLEGGKAQRSYKEDFWH